MDSTAIAAMQANTAALQANTGVLLVFMGVMLTLVCGYLVIRYTLRG